MSLPKPTAIIFDWDSTLVDNWDGINNATNAALTALGLAPIDRIKTIALSRLPHSEIFLTLFGEHWEQGRGLFYEYVTTRSLEALKTLTGSEDMLRRLTGLTLPLGIVSNKKGSLVRQEIDHLGWSPYFHTIVGSGDAAYDKPHHAPVEFACKAMGIQPTETVWFLGDIDTDMQAARAAGTTPILIETTTNLNLGLEGDIATHFPASRVYDATAFTRLVESYF